MTGNKNPVATVLSKKGWPQTIAGWGRAWGKTFALFAAIFVFAAGFVSSHAQTQATSIPLYQPAGAAYDSAGNLYITEFEGNEILKVDVHGNITAFAGDGEQGYAGDGGPAAAALIDGPKGIVVDASDNIYFADSRNYRIRKIDTNGIITTVAGNGTGGFSGDGGPAISAMIRIAAGIAVDPAGNVYFADQGNFRVREINVTTGNITTVAGNGDQGYEGDNMPAITSGLDAPSGIALDSALNLYICDSRNDRVRLVTAATGNITTFAGTGTVGFSGDGGQAAVATLDRPRGCAVDSAGNVYIADQLNQRVRAIAPNGTITTTVGTGEQGFNGDTGAGTSAVLNTPRGVWTYTSGGVTSIAIMDADNQRVRTFNTSTGTVNTIAGIASSSGTAVPPLSLALAGAMRDAYGTGNIVATISNSGKGATGTITLLEGTTQLGTGALSSNTATLTVPPLAVGIHQLVATYPGDSNNPAVASGIFVLTVTAAPVTATANPVSVLYGQPIPAITGTLSGVLPQDAANVTAAWSTSAVQGSPAGVYPITATLSGSAVSNYSVVQSPSSGSVIISAASSNTVLTSSVNPATVGAQVTLTATVTSAAGTPSGLITILDGTTSIGHGTLNNSGVYSFTTTALTLGTHSLTAVYAGSTNFTTSTSTAVSEVITDTMDFSVAPGPNSTAVTVSPGNAATYLFVLTPSSTPFTNPITFSVAGLPAGATATFTPASLTLNNTPANVTMTVQTPALAMLHRGAVVSGTIAFGLLLWPFFTRRRKSASRFTRLTATLLLMLGVASATSLLSGCSGAGPGGFFGQPPQTYTLTVTATSTTAAGAPLQHTATVQLTVE